MVNLMEASAEIHNDILPEFGSIMRQRIALHSIRLLLAIQSPFCCKNTKHVFACLAYRCHDLVLYWLIKWLHLILSVWNCIATSQDMCSSGTWGSDNIEIYGRIFRICSICGILWMSVFYRNNDQKYGKSYCSDAGSDWICAIWPDTGTGSREMGRTDKSCGFNSYTFIGMSFCVKSSGLIWVFR